MTWISSTISSARSHVRLLAAMREAVLIKHILMESILTDAHIIEYYKINYIRMTARILHS